MATVVYPELDEEAGAGASGTVYLMGGDTYNDIGKLLLLLSLLVLVLFVLLFIFFLI